MSEMPPNPAEVRRHREMLAIAVVVVVCAFAFRVRADDRVAVWCLPEYPLPHSCPSYACFGIKCPGCGLTRSIVDLAHGDPAASWEHHRLGWLLSAAVLLQFPYRILAIRAGGRPPLGVWLPTLFGYCLIALLLGNWAAEMVWRV